MSTSASFFNSPFDLAYDSPLNMPSSFLDTPSCDSAITCASTVVSVVPTSFASPELGCIDGFEWSDGTTTLDPVAWEYWVWYKYNDGTGRTYYYSPHYDISQYEVPVREGPADEYEDIVIRDQGLEIWQKHYRGKEEFPHSEPYYYNAVTGQIKLDMPKTGYVQVVRHYESIDDKGIRRNYTSVQFPRPPPVLVYSQR
jgi:hypothetical protein